MHYGWIESRTSLKPQLDLNQRGYGGATPLFKACTYGKLDAVRLLCAEPEVDPNISAAEHYHGHYSLHEAVIGAGCTQLLIIRALADKGAIMERENGKKETPFLLAFKNRFHADYYIRLIALLALGAQKKK